MNGFSPVGGTINRNTMHLYNNKRVYVSLYSSNWQIPSAQNLFFIVNISIVIIMFVFVAYLNGKLAIFRASDMLLVMWVIIRNIRN